MAFFLTKKAKKVLILTMRIWHYAGIFLLLVVALLALPSAISSAGG